MKKTGKPKSPNRRTVTEKQETFCRAVASGKSPKDAFREAYETKTLSEKTVYNRASILRYDPLIDARISELRRPIDDEFRENAILETKKIKKIIWERIDICREKGDESAIARYTDQLNRINGAYRDRPVEEENSPLDGLTLDEIRELANLGSDKQSEERKTLPEDSGNCPIINIM